MREARGLHAGQRFHSIEQRIGKRVLLLGQRVFLLRQREPENGGVFRSKTWIDMRELHETARQQTGAAEQHEREGHFDHDERAAQPAARAAFGRTARALLQRLVHIGARGEPRGRDAEDESGDNAEREREDEHAGIEMDFGDARQAGGGEGEKSIESPARQKHAGHAAAKGKDHALGEELAHEPARLAPSAARMEISR